MPENSPTPRHRRGGNIVLALTGAIGVTAIAGLGVVLAVLPGQDPVASSAARSAAAGQRFGREGPLGSAAPGLPAAGPFFSQSWNTPSSVSADLSSDAASQRPETAPESAPGVSGESAEEEGGGATGDGTAERQPAAAERGLPPLLPLLPPGHETGSPGSFGRVVRADGPSGPPLSAARPGGSGSSGTAGRTGTRDPERRRSARTASPGSAKPVTHKPDAQGSTGRDTAARSSGADTATGSGADTATPRNPATGAATPAGNAAGTAARDTGTGTSAASRAEAAGVARTRIQDPCLRFHDLRRAYCYEVLRRLAR